MQPIDNDASTSRTRETSILSLVILCFWGLGTESANNFAMPLTAFRQAVVIE